LGAGIRAGALVLGPRRAIYHASKAALKGIFMQGGQKIFDDLSKLITNAVGVAQGAKTEAETAMKGMIDRWMAERNFVTREEFDAVRAMAQKAREENDALAARIAALEGKKKG
jgi:BMFP domain-containing protein YqiC